MIETADPGLAPEPLYDAAWARAFATRHLAVLEELFAVGEAAIGAITTEIAAAPATGRIAALGRLSLAYDRVSRAVRLTVRLQSTLVDDVVVLHDPAARPARTIAAIHRLRRMAQDQDYTAQARRIAADLDEDLGELEDLKDLEPLDAEFGARHDRDIDPNRPITQLVARIRKDLGLAPDGLERMEGELAVSPRLPSSGAAALSLSTPSGFPSPAGGRWVSKPPSPS